MGRFTINGFARGMDTRRPTWAANASTLRLAQDVVLNAGGDAEVRKAFTPKFTGLANTHGLREIEDDVYVFGTAAGPTLPAGLSYIQITPSDGTHISRVLSSDLYDGKVYAAILMSDASVRHFYDGTEVADWFDGRARTSFDITAGATGTIASVQVNGVAITNAAVNWTTSNVATAAALAAVINGYTSVPNYEAVSIGATVIVLAADGAGSTPNGYDVAVNVTGDVTASAAAVMAGGVDASPDPGSFVRTHDFKVYSPAGSLLNFSSIDGPTHWNTDYDGAGFSDLSRSQSGSETLKSCWAFLEEMAVFAKGVLQIFHVEADDLNNRRIQTLDARLTAARAVAPFRTTDLLFLDSYLGARALTPSGTTQQFAKIDDVGLPIRKYLQDYQKTLTADVIEQAIAFVEPGGAHFWLVLGERVFVYSWHPKDDIEGWTVFMPGFQITDYAVANGRLYVRSGNTVYLYGGDDDDEYPDPDVGVITFSAFRASAPEAVKSWKGFDFGIEGEWEATLYASERDTTGRVIARHSGETFEDGDVPGNERSANPILKLTRKSTGYARVCQLVVNYTPVHAG